MLNINNFSKATLAILLIVLSLISCQKKKGENTTPPSLARQISGMHHWYGGTSDNYWDTVQHQLPDTNFPISYVNDSTVQIDNYTLSYIRELGIFVSGNLKDRIELSLPNDSELSFDHIVTHAGGSYPSNDSYRTAFNH